MRKGFSLLVLGLSLLTIPLAAQISQPTIPVDQIHAGMRGYALTVFEGVKPERMDVEVLGVMHNTNGPKGDVILVRLHGAKVEYTGVVAGMSGSPVYFNGKLAGALAFRIGEFSKRNPSIWDELSRDEERLRWALTIFDFSHFLAEELIRHPKWIWSIGEVRRARSFHRSLEETNSDSPDTLKLDPRACTRSRW